MSFNDVTARRTSSCNSELNATLEQIKKLTAIQEQIPEQIVLEQFKNKFLNKILEQILCTKHREKIKIKKFILFQTIPIRGLNK